MNFQQLRSAREAVRQGFNLTAVADVLHTSQPGVSRQIRELEDELGFDLFVRQGKRLTGLTDPGIGILPIIERLLQEADNLKRAGDDWSRQDSGTLTVAATHSQARCRMRCVTSAWRIRRWPFGCIKGRPSRSRKC
jgi:LysR family cys regulon transcriptional activator